MRGLENKEIKCGDVVIIRYEGPKGGPGLPEMLTPTSAIMGAGLGDCVALLTDGRFSGGSHGFCIGKSHLSETSNVPRIYFKSFNVSISKGTSHLRHRLVDLLRL